MITRSESPQGLDISAVHAFHAAARDNIQRALGVIRRHLDMDVAFISEFIGDWRYMHYVDTQRAGVPISVGDRISLQDGYCGKIVEGQLPGLIVDTADLPEAMAIPDTQKMPIGAHISVPLRLADGKLFGTFCCFNFTPRRDLRERDLDVLREVAEEVGRQIDDSDYQLTLTKLESILRRHRET
jgi:GAF domain-containing protein